MNDFDKTAAAIRIGCECSVGKLLKQLPTGRAKDLQDALLKHSASVINKTVKGWGFHLGESPITRHKAGKCRCENV